jgi:hypothetical protein
MEDARTSAVRVSRRAEVEKQDEATIGDHAARGMAVLVVTLVLLLALFHIGSAQAEPMPVGVSGTWALRLNEEFTSTGLNTSLWTSGWQHDGISGPMSGQCLSSGDVSQPGNGYVYLEVKAQKNTCGSTSVEDTGGLIESNPSDGVSGHVGFSYSYGYVEWRVYLPGVAPVGLGCSKGGCLPDWPALWSLSSSSSNEIDTMEGMGELGQACYHVHPPSGSGGPGGCASGSYAGWHTYGAEWEPGVATYYYDGTKVGQVSSGEVNSTPQYLIADMVPTGCCGGPSVIPDEMVVDYVRVWQHPAPPTVTTQPASGLAPLQAGLNARVNPNGADTHYYFQYGKTKSYGSSTGESDAGAGWSEVGTNITATGLEPGTTYHERIVATNSSGGPIYGNDQEFKTPGPVEATTSAATGVAQEQVTLNGTVNPRGYDAKYYFQYGPTSSYGTSTPEGDAGSGVGAVPESEAITDLMPGTTYHYRLVATSGGVTRYGADTTVKTVMPKAAVVEWKGTRHVYCRGLNGQLHEWYWNGTEWSQHTWGYEGVVAGEPTAVVHSDGSIDVYYRNTQGQIGQWWYGGSKPFTEWSQRNWGYENEVAGDPSAVVLPNGTSDVYYRSTKGALGHWWFGVNWSSEWSQGNWGYENEVAGDPSAVAHTNNNVYVYYRNTKGQLGQWWFGVNWSSEWSQNNWGYEHEVGGDPAAIALAAGGDDIYYGGANAQMWQWYINGTSWSLTAVGSW